MPETIDQLLVQSGQIITAWEAMGMRGGKAEDNLRMIREHVAKLGAIKNVRPDRMTTVDELAGRYLAMAWRIRNSTH